VDKGYRIPDCQLRRDRGVFDAGTTFAGLDRLQIAKTTVTGMHPMDAIDRLDQVEVAPMELAVFNVTFVD